MNQVWQFWHAQLNDDLINNIINVGEQYPIANAGLGFDILLPMLAWDLMDLHQMIICERVRFVGLIQTIIKASLSSICSGILPERQIEMHSDLA